jgi:hypothetical protein
MPQQTFDAYKQEWLTDILENTPTTTEKGHRFAHKLITQWLDLNDESAEIIYCDGTGDGGIDLACLVRAETTSESPSDGDTWYVVQSKYGTAFVGEHTLLTEGRKVIDTLAAARAKISSLSEDVIQRLRQFRGAASDRDRLVLLFATVDPLTEDERRALDDVQAMGRNRLGSVFTAEAVSVATVYESLDDQPETPNVGPVSLSAHLASFGADLWVGTVQLQSIYQFLRDYRATTGELDRIYEKNVRRYLGGRRRVNADIRTTLETNPEHFGLYNNGITIVAKRVTTQNGSVSLLTPYIVNGCQTTRTIWDVLSRKLESGGTGANPELDEWKKRLAHGSVITKVVQVSGTDNELLNAITRYTNSQNAVSQKDFIALTDDFQSWARQMGDIYDIFLEIQRGGWDSQRAFQRQHPEATQYTQTTNAFGLLKVYGAGWLDEPGLAFGKNPPFLPGGAIYQDVVHRTDASEAPFGIQDLFAAYLLESEANRLKFGRGAERSSRGSSRHLFYFVTISLLRNCMIAEGLPTPHDRVTGAVLRLLWPPTQEGTDLVNEAANLVDEYLTQANELSAAKEPGFSGDLNQFLKSEKLGKQGGSSPKLRELIQQYGRLLARSTGGQASPRQRIKQVINSAQPPLPSTSPN